MDETLKVLLYIASISIIIISVLFLSLLVYLIIILRNIEKTIETLIDKFKKGADGISRFWGLFKSFKGRSKNKE